MDCAGHRARLHGEDAAETIGRLHIRAKPMQPRPVHGACNCLIWRICFHVSNFNKLRAQAVRLLLKIMANTCRQVGQGMIFHAWGVRPVVILGVRLSGVFPYRSEAEPGCAIPASLMQADRLPPSAAEIGTVLDIYFLN